MSHSKHPSVSWFMLSIQGVEPPKAVGGINKCGAQVRWDEMHIPLRATGMPGYQQAQINFNNR